MAKVKISNPPAPEESLLSRAFRRLRRYFLTGMIVAMPLVITFYVVDWFINFVDRQVLPFMPVLAGSEVVAVPGIGLIIAIVLLVVLGWLATNVFGQTLISFGERIVDRMPVIRTIYNALKQIFQTVLSQRSANFREVGLIEYPRAGVHALAFITTAISGEIKHKIKQKHRDDEIIGVFLPTTPNPTSGFLLFLPRSSVQKLSMSIEEAAKMVVSGGLIEPEFEKVKKLPAPKKTASKKAAPKKKKKLKKKR